MKVDRADAVRIINQFVDNGLIPELMWESCREACIQSVTSAFEPFLLTGFIDVQVIEKALPHLPPEQRLSIMSAYCWRCGKLDTRRECRCQEDADEVTAR